MNKKQKNKRKPILIDVDGVLGGYCQRALEYARSVGVDVSDDISHIKGDTRATYWWKEANLEEVVHQPGYCSSIPVLPGAQDFVESVRSLDLRVVFLTSPYKNHQHWCWERFKWLEKNFNIDRTDLIFATDKRYVNGLIFLDDNVRNILDWQEYQDRPAVLIKQPWNEDILKDCQVLPSKEERPNTQLLWHEKKQTAVVRTNDWNEILDMVRIVKSVEPEVQEKPHRPPTQKPAA